MENLEIIQTSEDAAPRQDKAMAVRRDYEDICRCRVYAFPIGLVNSEGQFKFLYKSPTSPHQRDKHLNGGAATFAFDRY